ncbi:MAG: hypothetical protein AAFV45_00685 [Pseudomonadota bacterium]
MSDNDEDDKAPGAEKLDGTTGARDDKNERSTVDFPYNGLDAAEDVASALWSTAGDRPLEVDALAGAMGMAISGAFRQKTSAARSFGVVEKEGRSAFKLSPLGVRLVSPGQEEVARADAFLEVELYRKLYDDYRNRLIPTGKALEEVMKQIGVASKQADRARQAFERSARHAGYFWAGDNKLVRPNVGGAPSEDASTSNVVAENQPSQSEGSPTTADDKSAIIRMLVDRLPDTLDNKKLAQWLRTAEANLRWSYDVPGEIEIAEKDTYSAD